MGRETGFLYGFNAGVISREAIQRVDQAAAQIAGEVQENILPRVLGAAIMRPGLEYISRTYDDELSFLVPFVYSASEKALIELVHTGELRVFVGGAAVTRDSVSTSITNGEFTTNLSSWTDDDEAGTTSDHVAPGQMRLAGDGTNRAGRYQAVSVSGGDQGVEHAVRIDVARGPVYFAIGTSSSDDDVIAEQRLGRGLHSLAFTPNTGTIYVQFRWDGEVSARVDSCTIEAAGEMVLEHPWNSVGELRALQYAQSGDVIYLAHAAQQQRKLERRSNSSWSLVYYEVLDGPFQIENTTATELTPSARQGGITVTSSRPLFDAGHVNTVWRLTHGSSRYSASISTANVFTEAIRVSGIEDERKFSVSVSSVGSNIVTIQRAYGTPVAWEDWKTSGNVSGQEHDDGRDNEIIYYRIGIKTGDYVSGTTNVEIVYDNNSQSGVVRVRSVTNSTSMEADVFSQLASTEPTRLWNAPEWSSTVGWPGAVALYDGRMWYGARDKIYGSVSDAYESFDDNVEGDAGTVNRSIATGPFEKILWLQPLRRLLCGTAIEEISMQSSGFDEPITPTDFTARPVSQRGSADNCRSLRVDGTAVYVQRSGERVFDVAYSVDAQNYVSSDLTRLCPEICKSGVRDIAVQRMPDTRIWFVLNNGTAVCLLYERSEGVFSFVTVTTTDGLFKSVAVLPGEEEDEVYFTVERTGGVRTIEKMATMLESSGQGLSRVMDSFVVYDSTPTDTVTGLDHLIGQDVVVWADGAPIHDQSNMLTVDGSGEVELGDSYSKIVVGLPYNGRFKSAYLDYGAQLGVAIGKPQKITGAYLIARDFGWKGFSVGPDFDNLAPLRPVYNGASINDTRVFDEYIQDVIPKSSFGRGQKLCFEIQAPYPAKILGIALDVETGEGIGNTSR